MQQPINALDIILTGEPTAPCRESLARYTDLQSHRVVQVGRDAPTLVEALYLPSERDAVVLPADAVVTAGWLEAMCACFEREPGLATVTPFTLGDDAYGLGAELPQGYTAESMAALSYLCEGEFPHLTSNDSPCMLIRREALAAIAPLRDGGRSQKAILLELALRATQQGFEHALCATAFVQADQPDRTEAETQDLVHRYPMLAPRYLENPGRDALKMRDFIRYLSGIPADRKRILHALHRDFRPGATECEGEIQARVQKLVETFKADEVHFVLALDGPYISLTAHYQDRSVSVCNVVGKADTYYTYRSGRVGIVYRSYLRALRIDVVHVHHTAGLTLDIFHCAREVGIPVVATMQDYFALCPMRDMIDPDGQSCIGCDTPEGCARCLEQRKNISSDVAFIGRWRREHAKCLALCEKIIVPDDASAAVLLAYHPQLEAKMLRIEHDDVQALRRLYQSLPDAEHPMPTLSDLRQIRSGYSNAMRLQGK